MANRGGGRLNGAPVESLMPNGDPVDDAKWGPQKAKGPQAK